MIVRLRNSNFRPMTFMAGGRNHGGGSKPCLFSLTADQRLLKSLREFPDDPIFTYNPKSKAVDAVSSATARSYFESGFGYTYNKGERIDCTYLAFKGMVECHQDRDSAKL